MKITPYTIFKVLILSTISIIIIGIVMHKDNETDKTEVIIGFAGDVMLGRLVNKTITKTDYAYPWGNMLPLLQSTDLNIINLETTLTVSKKKIPKVFNFKADPDKVQTLQKARIDVVNLANNHILDFAEQGLRETIETVDKAGIKHIGAGTTIAQARKPIIINKNNISIGIIGYTDNEPSWKATEYKAGTNFIHVGDIEQVKQDIQNVRNRVDILIATIHWGPNMQERPSNEFINFAHQMIDSGIDIIHGHSAHIFQPIEIYNGKLIMYDTGDFVNDYMVDPLLRNNRSFLYLVTIDKQGVKKIQLVPVLIAHMQVNRAQGKDYEESIARIKQLSAEFNTKISNDGIIIIE